MPMQFILEAVIDAHLVGIDAFDRPAVEKGKLLEKRCLTQ
jgi:glucose-6-phosphate isomerase